MKIGQESPLSLLIWRRLSTTLQKFLGDVANCGGSILTLVVAPPSPTGGKRMTGTKLRGQS